ncbi:hypothetical protein PR003_g4095 [Phytophthora rubi]|uniref:Uncharacterized protein n=1 Tax=Phytophthora rubi TaxID=129364 RepID=A0A6A4FVY2_9STRA|nr:hypothetical protein PR001_g19032 [Phytophthora rubi]KAE9353005.1 hypothetical protein PR003_g4095 [Phytophthora rubi]
MVEARLTGTSWAGGLAAHCCPAASRPWPSRHPGSGTAAVLQHLKAPRLLEPITAWCSCSHAWDQVGTMVMPTTTVPAALCR